MDEKDKKLDWNEIEYEVAKIQEWFEQIPDIVKASAGERLIGEILVWCSDGLYQALGICEEVKLAYRKTWFEVMTDEQLRENAKDYRCIENTTTSNDNLFFEGKIYQATFEPKMGIYHLFADDEDKTDCIVGKESFESRFEPIES